MPDTHRGVVAPTRVLAMTLMVSCKYLSLRKREARYSDGKTHESCASDASIDDSLMTPERNAYSIEYRKYKCVCT